MFNIPNNLRRGISTALAVVASMSLAFPTAPSLTAADHAEATLVAADPGADIADVFAFLDPNDNTKVVLAMDVEGFVVPSEMLNLSFFAPDVTFRFEIENQGGTRAEHTIDVTFSPQTSRSTPQTATIKLPNGSTFTAPTTLPTLNASPNPFTVTTDPSSGASFFAGLTDDPFIFDIVGFNRFVGSVLAGSPDVTRLQRGRDSFAGYSIHMIAISVPASMLKGQPNNACFGTNGPANCIGINGVTLRHRDSVRENNGTVVSEGSLVQVDRMATPAVNTALIPFKDKNLYNASTTVDDANGKFAADIVGTLKALGTDSAHIGILASVAVTHGDFLRLNLDQSNTSIGVVGNANESGLIGPGETILTPGYTGFPNGRRPGDDTINTLLFLIANSNAAVQETVNQNDVPLGTTFPFFAPPHQPLENPAVDGTQN
jgi:hypothetical protein